MLSKKRLRELITIQYDKLRASEDATDTYRDTIEALNELLNVTEEPTELCMPDDKYFSEQIRNEFQRLQEHHKYGRHISIDFVTELDVSPSELEQVIEKYLHNITLYDKPLKGIAVTVSKVELD